MMRKVLIFLIVFLFSGCMIANTPTSKVEEYLGEYQKVSDKVMVNYTSIFDGDDIDLGYKKKYEELIRRQYKNLSYEIKDEEIDGDMAVVTAQIKVFDYREVLDRYNSANYSNSSDYHDLVIEGMKKQRDKIVYTISFEVYKNDGDEWELGVISFEDSKKLLGIN